MAKLLKLNSGTVTEGILTEPASGGVVALNDGSLQFFLGQSAGTTPAAGLSGCFGWFSTGPTEEGNPS